MMMIGVIAGVVVIFAVCFGFGVRHWRKSARSRHQRFEEGGQVDQAPADLRMGGEASRRPSAGAELDEVAISMDESPGAQPPLPPPMYSHDGMPLAPTTVSAMSPRVPDEEVMDSRAMHPAATTSALAFREPQLAAPASQRTWEVETDSGWMPWAPGVAFSGVAGEQVTYTMGRFNYSANFSSESTGVQINNSTNKQRQLRASGPPPGTWEVETDSGWTAWRPDCNFRGVPGEVVEYTLGRFQYTATFQAGGIGVQTNKSTRKARNLRYRAHDDPSGSGRWV